MERTQIIESVLETIPNMDVKNITKLIDENIPYDFVKREDTISVSFEVQLKTNVEYFDHNEEIQTIEDEFTFVDITDCMLVYFIQLDQIVIASRLSKDDTLNYKDGKLITGKNDVIPPSNQIFCFETDRLDNKNLEVYEKCDFNEKQFLCFMKTNELLYKKEVELYGKDYVTYDNFIVTNRKTLRLRHKEGQYINDWKDIYDIFSSLIKETKLIYSK